MKDPFGEVAKPSKTVNQISPNSEGPPPLMRGTSITGHNSAAHTFVFHTICSLIRLVFITSHLVYYSTTTSLDL